MQRNFFHPSSLDWWNINLSSAALFRLITWWSTSNRYVQSRMLAWMKSFLHVQWSIFAVNFCHWKWGNILPQVGLYCLHVHYFLPTFWRLSLVCLLDPSIRKYNLLYYAAADNSTAVIPGSVSAVVGALLVGIAVALLAIGILIRRKRMKQSLLTQEHYCK